MPEDRNSLEMSGETGELRHSYAVVARIKQWRRDAQGRIVTHVVEHYDEEYANLPGPKSLWLRMGPRKCWVWREVEVISISPTFCVRVIGSPAVRDAE